METVFISKLKPFLDAVAGDMELYVPKKSGDFYVYSSYDGARQAEFNGIRACTPVKEFLFPLRELAATYPEALEAEQVKAFAVFGLKNCDLRSIEILDKVFAEGEFEDPFYKARREKMFIISSDCTEVGESCFCALFDGKAYAGGGFDLNVSKLNDGFIVEAGSQKGREFLQKNSRLFNDVPRGLLDNRRQQRELVQKQLEEKTRETVPIDASAKDVVENTQDSELYDDAAGSCVECQACTRVCPTCHCFYLYDTKQKDYFAKMKMWDSCMRMAYASVAGGANPRKVLGERMKHRLLHKFVYFTDRYGINMCVGCGRCVDADVGGIDLRDMLKRLAQEYRDKSKTKVAR